MVAQVMSPRLRSLWASGVRTCHRQERMCHVDCTEDASCPVLHEAEQWLKKNQPPTEQETNMNTVSGIVVTDEQELSSLEFAKPGRCDNSGGNCAELAASGDGGMVIRNSRAPHTALAFDRGETAALIAGIKAGEYDHLLG